jgi:hypothetical protein
LHLFAHGDGGGGLALGVYEPLLRQIASGGFFVVAWASCSMDSSCENGEASFLEALKTIQYLEATTTHIPELDLTKPYSASGHSTGARVVLMLAAIIDTPAYLHNTKYAAELTPAARKSLSRIKAVVADHADPMYDLKQNPDFSHFNITQTPVMIVTGTRDHIEPVSSGWEDFMLLQTSDKVFLNIANATHLQPMEGHLEGPYLTYFVQYFALGQARAGEMLYGSVSGSILARLAAHDGFAAEAGARNTGNGEVGFVACGGTGTVPAKFIQYCAGSTLR